MKKTAKKAAKRKAASPTRTSPIGRLESHLGVSLPPALVKLYESQDGEKKTKPPQELRLMSAQEVIRADRALQRDRSLYGACPFWEGWNGNYALVFVDGPLKGRVCFYDDGQQSPVAFRSVNSFRSRLKRLRKGRSWTEMVGDYYTRVLEHEPDATPSCAQEKSDRKAADALRQLWDDERESKSYDADFGDYFFAKNIMTLTPAGDARELEKFCKGYDPTIEAFAIDLIATRRCTWAIPMLTARARKDPAAVAALGKIGGSVALKAVATFLAKCPSGNRRTLAYALAGCGATVREERTIPDCALRWIVKLPNSQTWQVLGAAGAVQRGDDTAVELCSFRNRFAAGKSLGIGMTETVIDALRKQIAAHKSPGECRVHIQKHSDIRSRNGFRLDCRIVTRTAPSDRCIETPFFSLVFDEKTAHGFENDMQWGKSVHVIDQVKDGKGKPQFVFVDRLS